MFLRVMLLLRTPIWIKVPYSYIYGTGMVNMDENKVGIF